MRRQGAGRESGRESGRGTPPSSAYVKLFFAPILWGGALVAGRIVTVGLPPFTITWVRFLLVTLLLVPALRIREGRLPRPTRSDLLIIVALALSGVVVFNFLLFSGLRTVTAVRSAVIIALAPAVVALLLRVLLGERTGLRGSLGIGVAFLGAAVTITEGRPAQAVAGGIAVGDLLLLGAVLAWAVYTITARYAMRRLSALAVLTYASAIGTLLLTPVVIGEGALGAVLRQSPVAWIAMLYLSFGAAGFAYLWYYEGIHQVGPSGAAIFLNLEPAAALVLGALLLREALTPAVLAGAVLVLLGMYLVNTRRGRVSGRRRGTPRCRSAL
ncbi:MAG: DMT family transporter [Spirochaetaceae bacterium]|nr:MAG: DMT family transporter [Spirochaetaceae bacterium]